jgi:uncharacterized protein (TIGR03085 family)
VSNWAHQERIQLVELCRALGPDAPTACGGWTTADLAAHLYIRERRPDAAPGVVGGPLAGYAERTMRSVLRVHDYEHVLSRLETGPPFPLRLADELINLHEFFIHHEDVRRLNGKGPRDLPAEMERLMWSRLRRMLRFSYRNVKDVRLEILPTTGDPAVVGRSGDPVQLRGPLGEIFLFSFNRKELAQVELSGDDAAVQRVRAAQLGV